MTTKSLVRDYYFSNVPDDLVGGLTAAIIALPVAIAFGVASGLGPAAGLYGAIAGGFFAAMFGGTAAQVSGPTGPMTLVVAAMLASEPDRPELVFAAVIVAGVVQVLLGRIRAGQLIEYIPYPVVSGFMSGIGIIIVLLQIGPLLGKEAPAKILEALNSFSSLFTEVNLQALGLGVLTVLSIRCFAALSPKLPGAFIALVLGTVIASAMNLEVPKIGEIPQNLPTPSFPHIELLELQKILLAGIALAILGSLDSLLTSVVADKTLTARHDSNQELTGQGIGNIAAGLLGGLPGAGATMRTIVNIQAGGRNRLSGMAHSMILLAIMLLLAPLASQIPLSVLAGILITVGLSIVDYKSFQTVRTSPVSDVLVMFVVLFLTVFVDLIIAVLVGVCLACALFVKDMSDAQLSEHGHLDTLDHLIVIAEHLDPVIRSAIYTYTFNGPLFFGEVRNFQATMQKVESARYIILRFTNVPIVDQSGALALEELDRAWEAKGAKIIFVGIRPDILKRLVDMGVVSSTHPCFSTLEEAVEFIDQNETRASMEEVNNGGKRTERKES